LTFLYSLFFTIDLVRGSMDRREVGRRSSRIRGNARVSDRISLERRRSCFFDFPAEKQATCFVVNNTLGKARETCRLTISPIILVFKTLNVFVCID